MTKLILILRLILLTFNLHLPRGDYKNLESAVDENISRELGRHKEKRKRRIRKIQPRPFSRNEKVKIHQGYQSSRPRDLRFSDQRKLRRMYRNG